MSNRVIENNFHLEHLLTKQTKNDLLEICRSLDIKGVSSLRKPKLISVLSKQIPEKVAVKMHFWDQHIYELMQYCCTSQQPYYLYLDDDDLSIDYLLGESIAFQSMDASGEYLVIPQEIQKLFLEIDGDEYRKAIMMNTIIARLAKGLLHYYGCLSLDSLAKFVNRLLGEPQEPHRIWSTLWEVGLYNWDIVFNRGYFSDDRVTDLDYFFTQLQTRKSLDYRPVSYGEVWQAGDPNFVHDQAEEVQGLVLLLEEKGLSEFTRYFLDLIFGLVQTELSPPEVVFALAEHLEIDSEADITELALLVFDYYHHVPHWVLKGHSPNEIMDHAPHQLPIMETNFNSKQQMGVVYDFATGKRMNQDAMCPCGSKRKFKHCCGLKVVSS